MKKLESKYEELNKHEMISISGGGWFNVFEKIADGIMRVGMPITGSLLVGIKDGLKESLLKD